VISPVAGRSVARRRQTERANPMLNKTYSSAESERRLYAGWESGGFFAADPGSNAEPFTIMIPPPNVTGSLHMGHALTFTLQDILIRWRRMQGRDALWQPGSDHAGIATQMVVERLLGTEGTTRQALGRERFVERVWQWKAESGGTITEQLRRLGASLDWPRERFTMDDGLSEAVREVFVTLHRQGLIYRDRRLVNWDPKFQSAISDLEVEPREVRGHLWHIRYPIAGMSGRSITVATTRPETMLGDTAIAVHPQDPRYRDLIGQFAVLPLVGRRIPIVADDYSDPEKGTGAVKITPAHDFNDFEVGRRHGLAMPSVLDREARITLDDLADATFARSLAGRDRFEARKLIVAELERLELLEKVEPHVHQVPHGDRSGVPIEPLMTVQWYCNAAELAKPAIAAVEAGRTRFVPQQWENTFFAWMRDIQPWCISRQLWWGHRIPAWYGPDGQVFVERTEAEAVAAARAHYGSDQQLARDEDVLDTWFSSALWPFSTLGWPRQTPELPRYYPGDVLVTGFDIIFFWVARMMMMGLHFMGEVPFHTVYIHGLVRDEQGKKMSKSTGNVIDPLDLIDSYGTDALRLTIGALAGPGRNVKLGPARVEAQRSFITKLWNAARFCEMNAITPDAGFTPAKAGLPLNRWILASANAAIEAATVALEAYRFDEYAAECIRFTRQDFCDWFLELAKPVLTQPETADAREVKQTAAHVLGLLLRLMHPVIPFVTEEIWDRFGYGAECSLMRADWPEMFAVTDAAGARAELDWLVRLISTVRMVRAEMNVPPSLLSPVLLKDATDETMTRGARWSEAIARMARASAFARLEGEVPSGSAQAVLGEATLVLPLAEVIDIAAERARLQKDRAKAAAEGQKIAVKLGNADFVARAPDEVVEDNRERLQASQDEVARIEAALSRLG
jgi:valyl-tRNA synthetase